MKRLSAFAFASLFCIGLIACAPGDKDTEQSMEKLLEGPEYTIMVRTMLREQPKLEADATGVMAPGEPVHLLKLSDDEKWARVSARGVGEVIFVGWVPAERITPSTE